MPVRIGWNLFTGTTLVKAEDGIKTMLSREGSTALELQVCGPRETSTAVNTGDPVSMDEERSQSLEGAKEERMEEAWGDSRSSAHP